MSDTATTSPPAAETPPPIEATPTFRKTTVADDKGVQSMKIYTSQNVLLTKDAAITPPEGFSLDGYTTVYTQDDWITVPIVDGADMDVIIHADQVLIYRNLSLPGRSLTIVARAVWAYHLGVDYNTPLVIDVSGKSDRKQSKQVAAGLASTQVLHDGPIGATAPTGSTGHGILCDTTPPDENGKKVFYLKRLDTSNGGPGWSALDKDQALLMNGNQGAPGEPGNKGGTIMIVTPLLLGVALDLRANGGDGGDGQDGQDGVKGGKGGAGASADWGDFGTYSYAASDAGDPGKGGSGGVGGKGGEGGACGSIAVFSEVEANPGIHVSLDAGLPGQHGSDGNPGKGGDPGSAGAGYHGSYDPYLWDSSFLNLIVQDGHVPHDGKSGDDGDKPNTPLKTFSVRGREWRGLSAPVLPSPGTPTVIYDEDASIQELAKQGSVDWLQMMVEKARLISMTTDPTDVGGYADWGNLVDWLVGILSLRDSQGGPGSELVKAALHTAWTMSQAHLMGQDGFGMAARWVPNMSVNTYLTDGLKAVGVLKDLEAKTASFWSTAAKAGQAQAGLTLDANETKNSLTQVNDATSAAKKAMGAARKVLDAGEKERSDAKDALTNALSSFKYAIESSFNLDPGTLLNCLSQMSFAGGSFAGSSALIGSQTLLALKDADENIRDDAGQKVNTSYLVKQLTSFIGHDWENSVKESRDGFIDDSSSYNFLDEASRIADLIDSFAQHPDLAKDVNQTAHALAKYVEMIDRRNSLVDQYNDSVRRLMFLNAQSDRLSVGADDIAANTTKKAGTNDATRAWADYYNVLTSGVREICLENLARAYRAAAFWCLSDIASFRDWVQGNPGAVTATALEAGFNGLQTALGAAIDAFHRTPGVFPEKPTGELADGWTAGGVLVVLTPEAHPWLFRQLRNTGGVADFEILPATNASPAPATLEAPCDAVRQVPITKPDAVDLSDSETEAEIANPFYDRANVRLTAVRPYVEGMSTTNNIHSVQIEHLGQERFQTVDDEPFPAPSQAGPYLNHDPATISFKYNASEYRFDPKLGFAAGALQHGANLEDGSLQFNEEAAEAGAKLPVPASYAPIGPFGVWRLRIDPNYNPGADLTTISRIIIDFRGYSDTFIS